MRRTHRETDERRTSVVLEHASWVRLGGVIVVAVSLGCAGGIGDGGDPVDTGDADPTPVDSGALDTSVADAPVDSPEIGAETFDAPFDAPAEAPTVVETLLEPKEAFTPTTAETMRKYDAGAKGTVYLSIRLEVDVLVGDFQPEIPDEGTPDRTEHILFGLFRANQTKSDARYLMGSAAVSFATKAPHFRMFGRSSIGAGYTTYTSWSQTYVWQKGKTYHLDCLLDGVALTQRCELRLGGALEKALEGAVPYLVPAEHLNTGFYVELGRAPIGDIETSPIGWTFSNLRVTARR